MTRTRAIEAAERSGMLEPANLSRFSARWVRPAAGVHEVVDTYWAVRWDLGDDAVTQQIVDFPAVTLSIERGDVIAPLVVTTVRPRAWSRVITGSGTVFALRLRPAGLAVLSDLDLGALPPVAEITPELDERSHGFLGEIARAVTVDERARAADTIIARALRERPVSAHGLVANAAVDVLTAGPVVRPGRAAAELVGTSERTLQRALRRTVGLGPNEVARRIRLQEVVRRLSEP